MKSKEKGVRLREEPFVVDVTEEDVFQKACYSIFDIGWELMRDHSDGNRWSLKLWH